MNSRPASHFLRKRRRIMTMNAFCSLCREHNIRVRPRFSAPLIRLARHCPNHVGRVRVPRQLGALICIVAFLRELTLRYGTVCCPVLFYPSGNTFFSVSSLCTDSRPSCSPSKANNTNKQKSGQTARPEIKTFQVSCALGFCGTAFA